MFARRKTFNPKRAFNSQPPQQELQRLSGVVSYGGNPEHKRNPGDFGLTPPADPRPDKTLCDGVDIVKKEIALQLLREGVRRGLVSKQQRNGFPQNIWAVTENEIPLEAQLENSLKGVYHGYPMPKDDAFREKVLVNWKVSANG